MNPIQSDLGIRISRTEIDARVAAWHRVNLAREASGQVSVIASLIGLGASIVKAAWRIVDPRGFAMHGLERSESVAIDTSAQHSDSIPAHHAVASRDLVTTFTGRRAIQCTDPIQAGEPATRTMKPPAAA